MAYEDEIWAAAHRADEAVKHTMEAYKDGSFSEEPAITGALVMALRDALGTHDHTVHDRGGLIWSAHVLRSSRGHAAEKSEYGADILFHVVFNAPELKYSKGALVQAKRIEPNQRVTTGAYTDLVSQCDRMLSRTPASFVFDYARST